MAQVPDGSGKGPVSITKPTTSVTSGASVPQKLVSASAAFANVLRGTFGPNGLDKMLYKSNGETAVTNDGAKIIAELLVKHPAAKAFVSLAESQENACGDGVTGCILFAGELMSEAGRLLERGLHPLILVKGYQMALIQTLSILDDRSKTLDNKLVEVAQTSLVGRSTEGSSQHLAKLVAKAVSIIEDNDFEKVRMVKDRQGTVADSRIIQGMVIDKRISLDRIPKSLQLCGVVVLSCPLELETTVRESEIKISTPEQLEAFIDSEEENISAIANAVIDSGAKVVFSAEGIDQRILHLLADAQIFAMGGIGIEIAQDISLTCDAQLCDHLSDIDSSLGLISNLSHQRLEGEDGIRERIIIEVEQNPGLVTILVGGSDGVAAEETIRGLFDALRSVCLAKEDDKIILGGGSLHMVASLSVRESAETCSGRERLAMEAFSRALEAIPASLAGNTGADKIDTLLELRSMHRSGNSDAGVDHNGKPAKIEKAWLPSYTLEHAISAACETACGLLRVDQVISARGD